MRTTESLQFSNPGINALALGIPVLSLFRLAPFSLKEVERVDHLVVGAVAIIAANLLINFPTSGQPAHKRPGWSG